MMKKILIILLLTGKVFLCQNENKNFKIVSGEINGVDPVVFEYLGDTTGKTNAENKLQIPIAIRTGLMSRTAGLFFEVKNMRWEATYYFDNPNTQLLALFSAADKLPFFIWVKDKNGKELQGAHMAAGDWLIRGLQAGNHKTIRDTLRAIEEYKTELKLYPSTKGAQISLWALELSQNPNSSKRIYAEFDALFKTVADNDSVATSLIPFYEKLGYKNKKDSLWKVFLDKYPRGWVSRSEFTKKLNAAQNPAERARLLEQWITEWKQPEDATNIHKNNLIQLYATAKDFNKAMEWLKKTPNPDEMTVNNLVNFYINENKLDGNILKLLDEPIERIRKSTYKPQSTPQPSWEIGKKRKLSMILDTYAVGLLNLKMDDQALKYSEEAYSLSMGQVPDITETLAGIYLKNKNYSGVIDIAAKLADNKKYSDKVNKYVEEAKAKILQKEKDGIAKLDEKLSKQDEILKEEVRKSMIDKPSFEFSLKALDGTTVKLSDLKGKIVILDFWATWCNPCKASFPALQEFYTSIKNRSDVVLLTIDTAERIPKEEIEKTVKDYYDENKFTFSVLFDKDNSVAKAYEANAIPTKVIIDKNGKIRFKTIGFESAGKMKVELAAQIELLSKG